MGGHVLQVDMSYDRTCLIGAQVLQEYLSQDDVLWENVLMVYLVFHWKTCLME